ncbi:hypothetical protein D9M72_565010 [compost metagenome]
MRADVGERELDIMEFWNAENIGEELLGETDAAGADDGNLEVAHAVLVAVRSADCDALGKIGAPWRSPWSAAPLPISSYHPIEISHLALL